MKSLRKASIIFFIFFLTTTFIVSEEFFNEANGYYLDVPEGWVLFDSSNMSQISFSDPAGETILQVYSFTGDSFANASDIYIHIKGQLNANGYDEPFSFSGFDSVIADLTFNTGQFDVRGYFIFINGKELDFAILAFTPIDSYEKNHDFLLSAIDSFSPSKKEKYFPGPISQAYYPYIGSNQEPVELKINNKIFRTSVDKMEIEASQVLVERESRILATYAKQDNRIRAWWRYYRIIYKDNYNRFKGLPEFLKNEFKQDMNNKRGVVVKLLSWIQNYKYDRTGTITDLFSPLLTVTTSSGDCDSRALLLLILLHHLKIDSILLVSEHYKHSAVGCNVGGDGAKISVNGKNYLYTELTEVVEIGQIPQKMSDASKWITMRLGDL